MELKKFFDNFELLADAPNGVQKLRELILQLAVQGKLVPQNPDDEPASVLLEKIKKEKERLIEEGKIKKLKKLPPVDVGEMAFELPQDWEWVRFADIATIESNLVKPDAYPRYPHIAPNNIEKSTGKLLTYNTVLEDKVISPKHFFFKGYILYSKIRPNLSKSIVVDFDGLCSADMYPINSYIYNAYLNDYLLSNTFLSLVLVQDNRIVIPKVNQPQLNNTIIPLPPLAEQHRIVAKVDALMKLCDELETRQQKKRDRILKLGQVATTKLITPSTQESFNQNWKTISDNFDLLYSTPENVKQLRQAILQLAVMGKLVPQNPDDEPASVLLEKIKKEKERLIKEGKIKKSKKLPPVDVGEMAFHLPQGWEWVRLQNICSHIVDGTHHTPSYTSTGVDFISAKNINNGKIQFQDCRKISEVQYQELIKRCNPKKGDVLVTKSGSIGRVAVVDTDRKFTLFESVALVPLLGNNLQARYLAEIIYINSSGDFGKQNQKGMAVRHLHLQDIRKMPIPLPPLSEQHRIVTKVDAMMKLCDELETKLTQSISDRDKLMSATVRQVLAA